MAELIDEVKQYIVQALACYDTPDQVAKAVKAEFDIVISRQHCENYDPNKIAGKRLSQKWRDLFHSTRKTFLEDISSIPIANRAVRIRRLERMADQAEKSRNMDLAGRLLEQIAKESGGQYTNKHRVEHTGKDGEAIRTETVTIDETALAAASRALRSEY